MQYPVAVDIMCLFHDSRCLVAADILTSLLASVIWMRIQLMIQEVVGLITVGSGNIQFRLIMKYFIQTGFLNSKPTNQTCDFHDLQYSVAPDIMGLFHDSQCHVSGV